MPAAFASAGEAKFHSAPSKTMRPDVACSPPAMIFTRVDFPAPLSPSSATTSPRAISKLIPLRASMAP